MLKMETNWTKQQIFDFALKVSEQLGYTSNCDLMKIFHDLGGRVNIISLQSRDTDDYFVCHRKDYFVVNVFYHLRRFEIAKAIGHYILHAKIGNQMSIPMGYTGRMEVEGNWFASRFLLPEPEFSEKWNQWKSVARLATHFDVPEAAVNLIDLPQETL